MPEARPVAVKIEHVLPPGFEPGLVPPRISRPVTALPWSQAAAKAGEDTSFGQYLMASRRPAYSLLFLLPLILAYELLALLINVEHTVEVRNGADVILREILVFLRIDSLPLAMILVLAVIVQALINQLRAREVLRGDYFALMFLESCAWAVCIGAVSRRMVSVFFVAPTFAPQGPMTKVMLFLGAGVYEELVFRVILIGALMVVLQRIVRLDLTKARVVAVLGAALLFSGFHHVGVFGEPFRWAPFLFRFFAGLVLSALYVTRGLGITAWAHALYDLFLFMELA